MFLIRNKNLKFGWNHKDHKMDWDKFTIDSRYHCIANIH